MKMFRRHEKASVDPRAIAAEEAVNGLKKIYKQVLLPLEKQYNYPLYFNPYLEDVDFEAKPMVLLLGQYSVGKTSFVRYLTRSDFPGMRIGPEPTTDKFVSVMYGPDEQVIPGNALCVAPDLPFRSLSKFGNAFLNKFEASVCTSEVLKSFTIIDSPGVLSGKKQRIGRQYDFSAVVSWFAERCDRIILLFDAHKLDISDEFKTSINMLKGHDEKVRVVLNKADSISPKELMRVYGALMWSLGKVVKTPEVLRVYTGSFWSKPMDPNHDNYKLFLSESEELLEDLYALPKSSAVRKVNELVKRARIVKVHAHIMGYLKSEMPKVFGKAKKQEKLLADLPHKFAEVAKKFDIPDGDFPSLEKFKAALETENIAAYPKLSAKKIAALDEALATRIPEIVRKLNEAIFRAQSGEEKPNDNLNPFSTEALDSEWIVTKEDKLKSDHIFFSFALKDGKLEGSNARKAFASTGLSTEVLGAIWKLVDFEGSNELDDEEFAVAMFLAEQVKAGAELPKKLPRNYVPASKQELV